MEKTTSTPVRQLLLPAAKVPLEQALDNEISPASFASGDSPPILSESMQISTSSVVSLTFIDWVLPTSAFMVDVVLPFAHHVFS